MGIDYYKVLGLTRAADGAGIKKAYRKMTIKWHPDKNPDNYDMAMKMFNQVAEAYEVLSDRKRRAIYDKYGEEGLKTPQSGPGYEFSGDSFKIFEQFFGTANPFATLFSSNPSAMGFGGPQGPRKASSVMSALNLSLEEMYNGCTKRLKVTRARIQADGRTTRQEEKFLTVNVQPGWKKGTKITFENEGDEAPGVVPADIVFILGERPHPLYRREGDDLVYTAQISLLQALTDCTVDVVTLDGRTLSVGCNEVISPGFSKTVAGEGMPGRSGIKGNLKITFQITFPKSFSQGEKRQLSTLLSGK